MNPFSETVSENFDISSLIRRKERTNGQTDKRKDESYLSLGITAVGITTYNPFFLLTFPGSVTYLKLMKPEGLGELCAATSDLASQTGLETSSPKGNDRSPESNVPRSDVVISAIKQITRM